MNFVPPPYADDVEDDFGPYDRDEIIVARASLLHSLQRETSTVWQGIKYKLGILPNGHRLRSVDPHHVWLPHQVPELWSAPVVLHDPAAPTERSGDDSTPEETETSDQPDTDTQEKERGRGKSPSPSEPQTTKSKRRSSDDEGVSKSKGLSGKRSFEDRDSSDDETSLAFSDAHDDSQKKKAKKSVMKKSKSDRTSKASSALTVGDAGEGSSKNAKVESCEEAGGENQVYEVVFQCDLCSFLSQGDEEMQTHLDRDSHYSASRYLAVGEIGSGEFRLVYLSVASLVKKPQHLFKGKVAACPVCHAIFPSLLQCLAHSEQNHKQIGQYSFRDITESATFEMVKETDACVECGVTLKVKDLPSHAKETRHMASYTGEKSPEAMIVFLCPFCQITYVSYASYKAHVFDKHAEQIPQSGALTVQYFTLGASRPAQTMLPSDPGVPPTNINYDFSKPPIPGDPGFRGKLNKRQMWRQKRKLRRLGLLPKTKKGGKNKSLIERQVLVAFLAEKGRRQKKKSKT